MQTAVVDGRGEISAAAFARLSPAEREGYRGRLSCPDRTCGAAVHFRSRSVDGRPPLFYSNNHVTICAEKSPETTHTTIEAERREDEAIWNDADELILRLDSDSPIRHSTIDSDGAPAARLGYRHDPQHGSRHTHASSIGLRPLLRRLRDDATFKTSTMPLTLSDGTRSTVQDACIHAFDYVGPDGRHVVWGSIARTSHGWINSGVWGEKLPAVRIRDAHLDEVMDRAHVSTFTELAPAVGTTFDFIVEGFFRVAKNGDPWVTIENPSHLALLPRPVPEQGFVR